MKYIRFENEFGSYFVLFSISEKHASIADKIGDSVASAGFVAFGIDGARCYGESISLRVHSSPADSDLLKREFNR